MNGLFFETATGNAKIVWDRIVKWRESDELLLIYQAPQLYHIIPKRIDGLAKEISILLTDKIGIAS